VKNVRLKALGERIRTIRKRKLFSQDNLAAEAGLDRAYYGGVERGERNIAALNLMKISVALSVEVGELFPPLSALRRSTKGERNGR
jgi:transcriptional regulator with XRE-family HTH domain